MHDMASLPRGNAQPTCLFRMEFWFTKHRNRRVLPANGIRAQKLMLCAREADLPLDQFDSGVE